MPLIGGRWRPTRRDPYRRQILGVRKPPPPPTCIRCDGGDMSTVNLDEIRERYERSQQLLSRSGDHPAAVLARAVDSSLDVPALLAEVDRLRAKLAATAVNGISAIDAAAEEIERLRAERDAALLDLSRVEGYLNGALRERDVAHAEVERLRALVVDDDPRHVIDFRRAGWTIKHPLSCRRDLFACPVNRAAERDLVEPPGLGRFYCDVRDGDFVVTDLAPAVSTGDGTRDDAEHASPHCGCGVNDAGQRYVDPICRRDAP